MVWNNFITRTWASLMPNAYFFKDKRVCRFNNVIQSHLFQHIGTSIFYEMALEK